MKSVLRFFSAVSLILGGAAALAFGGLALLTGGPVNWVAITSAVAYLISGFVLWALLGGVAEALERLERLEPK